MAGIDKTYTDSYKDYKEFKDWADKQIITFFSGYKVCVGDCIYECEEEDFINGEIPIMNSPTWLDAFLLQNCKVKFVIDRLETVYEDEYIDKLRSINLQDKPSDLFKKNRKIVVKTYKRSKFPIHNYPYKYKGRSRWWLQSNDRMRYHSESDTWINSEQLHPYNTDTSHPKTIKALIRHLRKQYLPSGVSFTLSGMYLGEKYLVEVK